MSGFRLGETRTSRWYALDQARIDAFARVTEDHQAIHDESAAARTPIGTPIAHGFLTLSMLSAMADEVAERAPDIWSLNYGFDRIRFLRPVPAGARICGAFTLEGERPAATGTTLVFDVKVLLEGEEKPALVATWLQRLMSGADMKGVA